MNEKPQGAITIQDKDGVDRGDWAWFIGSDAVPHCHGAFSEVILSLNGQSIRVHVSKRRKNVSVYVNHIEWKEVEQ